jgi:PKD domain
MPLFIPNVPVERAAPTIEVDSRELGIGDHQFELVVVDTGGNRSAPARWRLSVLPPRGPVAVITPPERIVAGKPFRLSGEQSTDLPGRRITVFIWELTPSAGEALSKTTETPVLPVPAFPAPGTLKVVLTVRDDQGATSKPAELGLEITPP